MCSPRSGAAPACRTAVRVMRSGLAMCRSAPISGCSTVTIAPRAARCASARWSSGLMHRHRRDAGGLQRLGDLLGDAIARPLGERARSSSCARREPSLRASRSAGSSSQPATARNALPRRARRRPRSPPSGRRPRTDRRRAGTAYATALPAARAARPVAGALEVELAREVGGRLGLRHVDELALAGPPPVLERGEHRDGAELPGDVVGVVQRRAGRIRARRDGSRAR